MRTNKFRPLALFILATLGGVTPGISNEVVEVVLLSGQSNMYGGGVYKDLSEPQKLRVYKASAQVSLADAGNPAKPLSFRADEHHLEYYGALETYGPELFLGTTLAEQNPTKNYLLIKTALGGTSLYGAWNPDWNSAKANFAEKTDEKRTTKLFELHLTRIRQQLASLKQQGKSGRLLGVCWVQGEQDTVWEVTAAEYEANLRALITAYRKELNCPNLPFLFSQTNNPVKDYAHGPAMVRRAQEKVAASMDHVAIIKTTAQAPWDDFPKHVDQVHYNTEGQLRLGTAFAKLLDQLNQ